eukprot:TRINITY_DN2763_c0_g1_i2.p1 TRINITY_DN2763_c0_g1~~TRINITY_DN2763_c0_g1_i2.p1  ORF type:complete len:256 (+),score=29.79 TRINITY_DN2763_c0_g1_i2:26-769(+)
MLAVPMAPCQVQTFSSQPRTWNPGSAQVAMPAQVAWNPGSAQVAMPGKVAWNPGSAQVAMPGVPAASAAGGQLDLLPTYNYGPRSVQFSPRVPVMQHNTGIIICRESIGAVDDMWYEHERNDDAIRNRGWNHIGYATQHLAHPSGPQYSPGDRLRFPREADISQAVDMHGLEQKKHLQQQVPVAQRSGLQFHKLFKQRSDGQRLAEQSQMVSHVLSGEVMGRKGVENFFSRPEAVSYEGSRSVGAIV